MMMMMMMVIPMDDGDDDGDDGDDDGDDDDDALSQAWFHHIKKWGLFHQVLDLRQLPMSRWHPSGTNQNIVNQLTAQVKKMLPTVGTALLSSIGLEVPKGNVLYSWVYLTWKAKEYQTNTSASQVQQKPKDHNN